MESNDGKKKRGRPPKGRGKNKHAGMAQRRKKKSALPVLQPAVAATTPLAAVSKAQPAPSLQPEPLLQLESLLQQITLLIPVP